MKFNYILFRKLAFVGLCILFVKTKAFLHEESVFCHNKRNCFPSYLDHYLIILSPFGGFFRDNDPIIQMKHNI